MQSQSMARLCDGKLDEIVCTGTPQAKICPCKQSQTQKDKNAKYKILNVKYKNTVECVHRKPHTKVCPCAGGGFWEGEHKWPEQMFGCIGARQAFLWHSLQSQFAVFSKFHNSTAHSEMSFCCIFNSEAAHLSLNISSE